MSEVFNNPGTPTDQYADKAWFSAWYTFESVYSCMNVSTVFHGQL